MLNFAVQFGLLGYFSVNPALHGMDKTAIEAAIKARDAALERKDIAGKFVAGAIDSAPLDIIRKLAKSNSQRPEKAIKEDTKDAMRQLFTAIAQVSNIIKEMNQSNNVTLTSQNSLFNCLLALATHASHAYTANEELLGYYIAYISKHATEGFESSFFGCWRAVEALQFMRARDLVAAEGWLKRAGRSLGFVTSPTPSAMKSHFGWNAATYGGMAAFNLVSAGWSINKSLQNKRQADCCVEVGWLIEQTLARSAETSTFVRWVNCSGGLVRFESGREKDWEKVVTVKMGKAPPKEATTAEFLMAYLNRQEEALQENRAKLRNELLDVVWKNVN
ncbi:MAG: hypothetical protein M1814_005839 [Vezdaea aestivalis]|nr:MAG: hypothetical protein M1814_005839 [Vezdaea aestivalis]